MSADAGYRLSPQQARIWEVSGPDPSSFVTRCAIALRGELDHAALQGALLQLVSQHEILRTAYRTVSGAAVQQIQAAAPPVVSRASAGDLGIDLNIDLNIDGAHTQDWLPAIRQRMTEMPGAGALSGELIALAPALHVLLLCVPSLSADASSLAPMTEALGRLYRAQRRGPGEAEILEVMQYVDVAEAWNELLEAAEAEPGRRYWRGCDLAPVLRDGAAAPAHLARVSIPVAPSLARGLEAFAAAEACAVPTAVLACWQLLIARLSESGVWSVAVALDGRSHEGLAHAVGAFVRYVPMRASVPMHQPFRAWLGALTEARAEALAWQDTFEPASAGRGARYLRCAFSSVELPPPCTAGGLDFDLLAVDAVSERSDVELVLVRRGPELELVLRHDPAQFAAAFPEASPQLVLERLIALLESALAAPQRSLAELSLLGPAERARLAGFAAAERGDWSCEHTVHERFLAQARATPERTAVVFGDEALGYGELARRAHQLAHHLRALGVGPEARVAVCLERSAWMLVAILGILEAGGAYVPLDPAYPRARLELMLHDAGAEVLISHSALRGRVERHGARVVLLDADAPAIAAMPASPLPAAASPDHLAYIIYTSGSTGQPKGVMIQHRSVVNLAFALEQRIYARHPGALRIAMTAPLTFDASVKQWLQLLHGHTLVIVPEEARRDPAQLLALLRAHAIDALDVTPSLLRLLLAQGLGAEPEAAPRLVLVGGEAIDDATWQVLAAQARTAYVNVYGPTECTVDTTAALVTPGAHPSIGRPLGNVRVHLLDHHMNPVPVGVPGQIHVGGAGLARGYLGRPDLTAERFVPDPFGEPAGRLYRTGDLGRYRPDGTIEFLGRVDHQVKVRGFRIELGEIEAVLAQHPAVARAVVAVREDAQGQPRLVAYVVARGAPAMSELRDLLQEQLPAYMLPQAFVSLDALPLTPHGKIDRGALPAPDALRPDLDQAFTPPQTPIQAAIAEVWTKVLGVDRVGVHDDFFALGGHSLTATQVVSRLRTTWQIELPLREIFDVPTVAGLAERVEAARGQAWPEILPVPRDADVPLSFAQQRLWFLDQLEPGSPFYNVPAAVRIAGPLEVAALAQSLRALVARHEVLRTTFPAAGGQPRQAIADTADVALAVHDLRTLPAREREDEVRRRAHAEARAAFDLARGPLLRATLLALGEQEHVLLFVVHHIVFDGWSSGVLIRELGALYPAFAAGAAPALAALPVHYADYAVWQRRWFDGGVRARELAYWRQALSGAPAFLDLPTDRPRPPVQRHRGAIHTATLPPALVAAVDVLGQRTGTTRFMILLGALAVLLGRHARTQDVCIGSPVAGRVRPELEALIGCFLNTLVLRCDLSGDPTVHELLRRVRAMTLGAYEHQHVPFEEVVDALAPPRDASRAPLFQVMLILQNAPMPARSFGGITLQPHEIDGDTAKFDLTLTLGDAPGGAMRAAWQYDADLFDEATVARMASQLERLLAGAVAAPETRIGALPLLTEEERHRLLIEWNQAGAAGLPPPACIHAQIATSAARTPHAVAVTFADEHLTYAELSARAGDLARHLRTLGVGPEVCVGLCMERSLDMVVGLLAILEAGGAYLPLDPEYPRERLAFMLEDAGVRVLLTQRHLAGMFALPGLSTVVVPLGPRDPAAPAPAPAGTTPDHLAYVIYTSGSTGKPKGVMVPHRAVSSFFAAMDLRLGDSRPGVWLAITSLSFDISVLELLWTLARGFHVVVDGDGGGPQHRRRPRRRHAAAGALAFSLFYFADDSAQAGGDPYRLLLEGARFADEHGFAAVWTPERHFHSFGGLYPNPSVVSAALAVTTRRIGIRAGSVVMPLHHPVRVAEEWAVVDNLSRGRVGISFASGWHADDFMLAPDAYARRREVMLEGIDQVRRLWRGERLRLPSGVGQPKEVEIRPRPIQAELPCWLTAAGNPETFRSAGRLGASVLTHLLGQTADDLQRNIAVYREAWQAAGHPGAGHVTLMLHTFVHGDAAQVRARVAAPFRRYLASSVDLLRGLGRSLGMDVDAVSPRDLDQLLDHAFDRYFETSGLFGTPSLLRERAAELHALGVDEIGCLIDFGIDPEVVLDSLPYLDELRQLVERDRLAVGQATVAEQIHRHEVTHLQCTPSWARTLAEDPASAAALGRLSRLLVGGEALPAALASTLCQHLPDGRVLNMYGPTETTIWSSMHRVTRDEIAGPVVSIGRAIAGTSLYVLDPHQAPVPVGVPGELYIGGLGVARGYLGRPALTAERFVPDPFGPAAGARMYRTGDRVRWLADGTLEFLGRVDHQLKVRGFRIEAGEIEAVLASHPGVRQAVVIAREDEPGDVRLVGYVVAAEPAPEAAALRAHLQQHLPQHMVPSALVTLAALPLTPNGKLDRKALPAPTVTRGAEAAFVAPRGPLEREIAQIWQDVLRIPRVGVHDDFFDLGGHSLLATQVVARLRAMSRLELPLRVLFEHPTVAGLARHVEAARGQAPPEADPRDLRAASPRPAPAAAAQAFPAPPRSGPGEPFPMTDLQQAYWLGRRAGFELGQISPTSYVELELAGELELARLEQASDRLIARHEMLRAVALADGRLAALAEVPRYRVAVLELGDRTPEEAERELDAERRRLERRAFTPEAWPLFELRATRLPGGRVRLHFVRDLLLADVRSSELLLAELARLYADPDTARPAIGLGFGDYTRRLAADPDAARAEAYWRGRLADLPPPPPLPMVAGAQEVSMRARRRHLDAATWEGLSARVDRAGLTPSVVLCAAFADVLAAWAGTYRFTINLMYDDRRPLHPHVERVVGNFGSTLLLEVDARAARFDERARRLASQLAGDLHHAAFSGVRVLRELNARRGSAMRAGMPVVFSSMVPPGARPAAPASSPPARMTAVYRSLQTPQVKLECVVSLVDGRPHLTWNAIEELFPPGVLDAMFASYGALVEELAADDAAWTGARRAALPTGELAVRARVNATAAQLPAGLLHEPFLARARTQPDALAVIAPERTLTYAELDAQARAVTAALRVQGARPRELVAVVMDKHWAQIAAVLGALGAGAAYLPIDPAVPAERLRYLLGHAGVRHALTTSAVDARVTWPGDVTRLQVDRLPALPEAALAPPAASQDDLAYVIYTSGSTGVPKGVMISHRGALNTIVDINERFAVGPGDRILALSSLSFDLSVYDVFGALAAGATLVVPAPSPVPEPARWLARVQGDRVTIVNAVPALVEMLVEQAEATGARLGALRLVMMSGDWIPVPLPDRLRARGPDVAVVSLGGATEASIWSVIYPIGEVDPAWPSIPYGRPLRNQGVFVLDEQLEPCPVWTRGMIYLGGVGLAEGYLHDPDRTSAAFVRHPRTGERLYRTGDLGRWLPGGEVEILGREDLQVKIQGYRVELAEIEAVLMQHPAVAAAVVIAAGEPRGARRLIGHVVPARGAELTPEVARQIVAERLPAYMVPARVVILDALPLTANGKVDRAALAERAAGGGEAGGGELPRDPLEHTLARLVAELVGAAAVGIHDDFFALGGNSLLALRLTTRVARELGHTLALSQLFAAPTVARMAGLLRGGDTGPGGGAPWSPLVTLAREGAGHPFFCVHPVGGGVLCFADLARHLAGERPIFALEARGLERELSPLDRIEDLAALYLRAMRAQRPRGPYVIGGWSMGAIIAFELARQLVDAGEEVALVAMIDPPPPRAAPALRRGSEQELLLRFAADLARTAGRPLLTGDDLADLPFAALFERFLAARDQGILPADLTEDQVRRLLGVFRAHERALETYVARPYPGRVALLCVAGADDRGAWSHLADVLVRPVPGDHYDMLREPHVRTLAAELRALFAAADGAP